MNKLISLDESIKLAKNLRKQNQQIAWTNGCFDILHAGHVDYLQKAKAYGDVLIVGINSDSSIQQHKGSSRPICNEQHRLMVLNAIIYTDYIILFEERTPLKILQQLQPDFYIKGGDYTIDTIDQTERRMVESYGGKIVLLPLVDGVSTSIIIEKMKSL